MSSDSSESKLWVATKIRRVVDGNDDPNAPHVHHNWLEKDWLCAEVEFVGPTGPRPYHWSVAIRHALGVKQTLFWFTVREGNCDTKAGARRAAMKALAPYIAERWVAMEVIPAEPKDSL